jgi:hypothetical protein
MVAWTSTDLPAVRASGQNLGWLLGGSYAAFLQLCFEASHAKSLAGCEPGGADDDAARTELAGKSARQPYILQAHRDFLEDLREGSRRWRDAATDHFVQVPVYYRIRRSMWQDFNAMRIVSPGTLFVDEHLEVIDSSFMLPLDEQPWVVLRALQEEHVHGGADWPSTWSLVSRGQEPHPTATLSTAEGSLIGGGAIGPDPSGQYRYENYEIWRHERAVDSENKFLERSFAVGVPEFIEVVHPDPVGIFHVIRRHRPDHSLTVISERVAARMPGTFDWPSLTDGADRPGPDRDRTCKKLARRQPGADGACLPRHTMSPDGLSGHTEFFSLAPVVANRMVERLFPDSAMLPVTSADGTRSKASREP